MNHDIDNKNREWIEGTWTRFQEELSAGNYETCEKIQEASGDNGFVNDALKMHHMINADEKRNDYTWVPYEHPLPPIIKPSEMEAPKKDSFLRASEWEHPTDAI